GDPGFDAAAAVIGTEPGLEIVEGVGDGGERVGLAVGVTGGVIVEDFIGPPMPVIVGIGSERRGIGIDVGEAAVMRADGRAVEFYVLLQGGDGVGGIAHVLAQFAGAEEIVTARAVGGFPLGGRSDGNDEIGNSLHVMAEDDGGVVLIGPGAELGDGSGGVLERPLDCVADDSVGIH